MSRQLTCVPVRFGAQLGQVLAVFCLELDAQRLQLLLLGSDSLVPRQTQLIGLGQRQDVSGVDLNT